MRINRPSLHAAFGNKEELFFKALDRYGEGPVAYVRDALTEPKVRAVVERIFQGAVDVMTDKRNPSGCLMVQGAQVVMNYRESRRWRCGRGHHDAGINVLNRRATS